MSKQIYQKHNRRLDVLLLARRRQDVQHPGLQLDAPGLGVGAPGSNINKKQR